MMDRRRFGQHIRIGGDFQNIRRSGRPGLAHRASAAVQ